MVRVGILDLSGNLFDGFDIDRIPPGEIRERIEKTKNKEQKACRIAAYLLLEKMIKNVSPCDKMPQIIYTPQGKPRFDEGCGVNISCRFNISHDGGAVAVAVSDTEVGVDVQSHLANSESQNRIATRFADALDTLDARSDREPSVSFCFFEIKNGEIFERLCDGGAPANLTKEDVAKDFVARWTVLEAALKLDGGGFASIGNVRAIVERAKFKTVAFNLSGNKYALTVAEENK